MTDLVKNKATICIVNYKTLQLTRLCLRSIRKFTRYPCEVIVVDNDSNDDSLKYLQSLAWIRLIRRNTQNDHPGSGGYCHAAALDLALQNCRTEFFVAMHSDTFVHRPNWLAELMTYFKDDENIACVGSGKIELTPKWRLWLKKATDFKTFKRKLLHTPDPIGRYRYYNRTICCVYRTDVLRRENLSFLMNRDKGLTVGKKLYFELLDRGYKTIELPPSTMARYIVHLAHATQAANPEEFTLRKRTIKKCNHTVRQTMASPIVKSILNAPSLDE